MLRSLDRPEGPGESSFSAVTTSAFDPCSAGASPNTNAATSDSPVVKAITRPSSASVTVIGNGREGSQATSTDVVARASSKPAPPATRNSVIVSVRSCRIKRARPAPMASRTAISLRRAAPRASRMLATLAHATTNTSDTITVSSATNAAITPRLPGTRDEGNRRSPRPPAGSGYSRSSAHPSASNSAAACATETPGFRRPPITSHPARRLVRTESRGFPLATVFRGSQTSAASMPVPWKPSGTTPTTVNACPLSRITWPTTAGSSLKRRFQKP